ncbi:MYND-type zinc finger protein mub1 [Orobanche minor]
MSGEEKQVEVEIKFRLTDGTDIGPKSFGVATTAYTLKEYVMAQWPKNKENSPRTVQDIKLISGGKILENNATVGGCKNTYEGVTTMHVVVQPPSTEKEKKQSNKPCGWCKHGKNWNVYCFTRRTLCRSSRIILGSRVHF